MAEAEQFVFSPPFSLQQNHGETILIKTITIDEDIDGGKLYLYETTSGQSGFTTKTNIVNFLELKNAMYPPPQETKTYQPRKQAKTNTTTYVSSSGTSSLSEIDPEAAALLLNSMYGKVCKAEIKGFFSKTLKIDWTYNTKLIHSIKVLAEIGNSKEQLYRGGIRYLQFPNNAGGYNVIDWETGEKRSISDSAPYFFK